MKKDIETIKNNPSEMKNTISDIKNTLEGINSRLHEAEDRTSNLEDKVGITSHLSEWLSPINQQAISVSEDMEKR